MSKIMPSVFFKGSFRRPVRGTWSVSAGVVVAAMAVASEARAVGICKAKAERPAVASVAGTIIHSVLNDYGNRVLIIEDRSERCRPPTISLIARGNPPKCSLGNRATATGKGHHGAIGFAAIWRLDDAQVTCD